VFEISTAWNDFWKDWQVELAKEDLRRRARTAMDKIMRDGVPYVTCLYPVKEGGGKLVLTAFCVLAQYEDCVNNTKMHTPPPEPSKKTLLL
jgi:hypothetical protein